MATTANTPALSSDVAVKSENLTYRRFAFVDAEGKIDPQKTKLSSSDKTVETLKDNKEYAVAGEFTVISYSVGSEEGFLELIPDADERVNIINRGIAAKFNAKVSPMLKEYDETTNNFVFGETSDPVETIDMLREVTNRKLGAQEKAIKTIAALNGFSEEQIRAALASLMQASQSS